MVVSPELLRYLSSKVPKLKCSSFRELIEKVVSNESSDVSGTLPSESYSQAKAVNSKIE